MPPIARRYLAGPAISSGATAFPVVMHADTVNSSASAIARRAAIRVRMATTVRPEARGIITQSAQFRPPDGGPRS